MTTWLCVELGCFSIKLASFNSTILITTPHLRISGIFLLAFPYLTGVKVAFCGISMWICSVINHWIFKALSDNNIYLTVYIYKPQLIGQRLLFQLPYIQSVFTRLKSWWTYVVWSSQISYLQATQREMASVLISDLYGKHLSQDDIAQGKLVVSTITCVRCSWRLMRRR